jgi:hypothetical protein
MAPLFHRQYGPSRWDATALAGPMPRLTLRQWEVSVILCTQTPQITRALRAWLIAPTHPTWPRPDTFTRHLLPFTASDLTPPAHPWPAQTGQPQGLPGRLWEVIKAIRQTLDMPLDDLHGITRDLLLVAHGTRLRQIIAALGQPAALQEIAAMQRLPLIAHQQAVAHLSARWGGRWAPFFSGAGTEAFSPSFSD